MAATRSSDAGCGSPPMCRLSPTRVTSSRYGRDPHTGQHGRPGRDGGPVLAAVAVADHAAGGGADRGAGAAELHRAPPGRGRLLGVVARARGDEHAQQVRAARPRAGRGPARRRPRPRPRGPGPPPSRRRTAVRPSRVLPRLDPHRGSASRPTATTRAQPRAPGHRDRPQPECTRTRFTRARCGHPQTGAATNAGSPRRDTETLPRAPMPSAPPTGAGAGHCQHRCGSPTQVPAAEYRAASALPHADGTAGAKPIAPDTVEPHQPQAPPPRTTACGHPNAGAAAAIPVPPGPYARRHTGQAGAHTAAPAPAPPPRHRCGQPQRPSHRPSRARTAAPSPGAATPTSVRSPRRRCGRPQGRCRPLAPAARPKPSPRRRPPRCHHNAGAAAQRGGPCADHAGRSRSPDRGPQRPVRPPHTGAATPTPERSPPVEPRPRCAQVRTGAGWVARHSRCMPASVERSRTSERCPGMTRSRAITRPSAVVTHRQT